MLDLGRIRIEKLQWDAIELVSPPLPLSLSSSPPLAFAHRCLHASLYLCLSHSRALTPRYFASPPKPQGKLKFTLLSPRVSTRALSALVSTLARASSSIHPVMMLLSTLARATLFCVATLLPRPPNHSDLSASHLQEH